VEEGGAHLEASSVGGYHGRNLPNAVVHSSSARHAKRLAEDDADDLYVCPSDRLAEVGESRTLLRTIIPVVMEAIVV
jgi:hypothetical protein